MRAQKEKQKILSKDSLLFTKDKLLFVSIDETTQEKKIKEIIFINEQVHSPLNLFQLLNEQTDMTCS